MKKYFQFLLFVLFVSCSSSEKAANPKTYSDDTNRAFEMIERGGSYYLKKAPTYNAPPQIEAPARKRVQAQAPERLEDSKTEVLKPVLKNTNSTSKADERLIEINQNLAFYCMKHRKNPAYGGDEAKCMKHVNAVMGNCQKQHRIVNSKLLNCIQKKLKK